MVESCTLGIAQPWVMELYSRVLKSEPVMRSKEISTVTGKKAGKEGRCCLVAGGSLSGAERGSGGLERGGQRPVSWP